MLKALLTAGFFPLNISRAVMVFTFVSAPVDAPFSGVWNDVVTDSRNTSCAGVIAAEKTPSYLWSFCAANGLVAKYNRLDECSEVIGVLRVFLLLKVIVLL